MIVYTGKETRAVMNTGEPAGQKMGRIEWEVNKMAKVGSARSDCCYSRVRADGLDPMYCHIRVICLPRSSQRFQGKMVHLRCQIPYPLLFHHTYKVSYLKLETSVT